MKKDATGNGKEVVKKTHQLLNLRPKLLHILGNITSHPPRALLFFLMQAKHSALSGNLVKITSPQS